MLSSSTISHFSFPFPFQLSSIYSRFLKNRWYVVISLPFPLSIYLMTSYSISSNFTHTLRCAFCPFFLWYVRYLCWKFSSLLPFSSQVRVCSINQSQSSPHSFVTTMSILVCWFGFWMVSFIHSFIHSFIWVLHCTCGVWICKPNSCFLFFRWLVFWMFAHLLHILHNYCWGFVVDLDHDQRVTSWWDLCFWFSKKKKKTKTPCCEII